MSYRTSLKSITLAILIVCAMALGGVVQASPKALSSYSSEAEAVSLDYAVSNAAGELDAAYHVGAEFAASNPAQGYDLAFGAEGVTIESNGQALTYALSGFGYGDSLTYSAAERTLAGVNRVDYARGALTEWYVNGPSGLQQGFTFAERLAASANGWLTVAVAIGGDYTPTLRGNTVELVGKDGSVLSYGGLLAYDAAGKFLPVMLDVSGNSILLRVNDVAAVYPLTIDPIVQQQKLNPGVASASGFDGRSVAIDGAYAVVGAPGVNGNEGRVFVYERSGATWSLVQTLSSAAGGVTAQFGTGVALSLPYLAVGAAGANSADGAGTGEAYIYELVGSSFTLSQGLTASTTMPATSAGDSLGQSVALSPDGSLLIVGAPTDDRNIDGLAGDEADAGSAYVFELAAGSYTYGNQTDAANYMAFLGRSFTANDQQFAWAVDIANDGTVLIGAPSYDGMAVLTVEDGLAFTSSYSSVTNTFSIPVASSIIPSNTGVTTGRFGFDVSLNSTGAVVGEESGNGVQIFDRVGSTFSPDSSFAGAGDFGYSVQMDDTRLLIGAPSSGTVFHYLAGGGTWAAAPAAQTTSFTSSVAGDLFGSALALDGDFVLVGAPSDDTGATDAGSAYVFSIPTITVSDVTVTEGNSVVFTFTRSDGGGAPITINYTFNTGTTEGADRGTATPLTGFSCSTATCTVTITTVDDNVYDDPAPAETLTLSGIIATVGGNPVSVNGDVFPVTVTGTITDNETVPVLSIVSPSSQAENVTPQNFTAQLSSVRETGTVTFNCRTLAGSASNLELDYTARNATPCTENIPAGTQSVLVPVALLDDNIHESDEFYSLSISGPVNATLGSTLGIGYIDDNDPIPTVSISCPATVQEGDAGTQAVACTISLTNPNSYPSSVLVSVSPIALEADASDIVQVTTQLVNIPAGTTSVQFLAQVVGDIVVEDDETFDVTLTTPVNLTLGTATSTVSIVNDDTAFASIVVDNASILEVPAGTATYTVTLSKPTEAGITISLTTSGTATNAVDTTSATPISVACAALATTCTTVVQTAQPDAIFEGPETLSLTVAPGAGYSVGTPATATTIIVDNNAAPAISLTSCTLGDEAGPTDIICTVSIPTTSQLNTTANFVVIPGTATTPQDYSTSSGLVTILAGNTTGTFTIDVVDDPYYEGGNASATLENLLVILTSPVNAVAGADMSEQAQIIDNDTQPSFQLINGEGVVIGIVGDPNSQPESLGQVACVDMVGTISAIPLELGFFFNNGTAISGEDFQYVQDQFTIPALVDPTATNCEYAIQLPVIDDLLWEGGLTTTESMTVELFSIDNGLVPAIADYGVPLTMLIEDNETVAPQIRILDAEVVEGDAGTTQLVFTAQLVDGLTGTPTVAGVPVTFNYVSAAGTATVAVDYVADVSGTATILKGQTSTTIIVTVNGDTLYEPNETLTLTGSAAAPAGVTFLDATAIGTIINDDTAPTLTVSVAPISAAETDANNTRTVTVSVPNGSTTQPINFNYTFVSAGAFPAVVGLAGGCPAGNVDVIQNTASGTITPVIGNPASFSTTFLVTVCGDNRIDADTETAGVRLSSVTNVNPLTSVFAADFDIVDDDTAAVNLSGPATVAENAGVATYTVTLVDDLAAVTVAGTDVTVTYSITAGTATAAVDYIAGATGSVTIPAGSSTATFTVAIVNDLLDENNEDYTVVLTGGTAVGTTPGDVVPGATINVTTTITDDDASPVVSIDDVTIIEGTGGTTTALFTVSQTTISSLASSVTVTSTGGTATDGTDYTAVATTATIPAGQLSVSLPVSINPDALDEANETYTLTLSAPVNATLGDAVGAGVIIDDDESPTLSVADVAVAEGNAGTTPVTFTFTLSAISPQTIPFTYYFVQNGTASAVTDYAPGACVIATPCSTVFPANSLTHTVAVAGLVLGDTVFEANETFGIVIVPTNGSQVSPFGSDLNGVVTITNDDTAAGVVIDVNDAVVTEGNSVSTLITLTSALGQDVTVTYSLNDATAVTPGDYQDQNLVTAVIPAGSTSVSITVATNQDTLFEVPETFNIQLISAIAADTTDLSANIFGTPGVVTINDDGDAQPVVIIGDLSLAEGNAGNTLFNFPVTLNTASGVPVTVNWTRNVTSAEASDFDIVTLGCGSTTGSIIIPAGLTTGTITLCVVGDTVYETNEDFNLSYVVVNGSATPGDLGLGSIINDDAAPTISIDSVNVTEGNIATLTITRTGATEIDVTGTFASTDVTATAGVDYSSTSGNFTIVNSLAASATTTVTVTTLQDLIDEPAETLNVVLSNLTGSSTVSATGVVTIDDDDAAPTISISDVTAVEGQNLTFTLTLSNPSASTVSVTYNLNDGTAIAGDYVDATGSVSFAPGELSKTLVVETVQDTIFEAVETFTVDLTLPVNASILDAQGVGTITDNDAAPTVTSQADFSFSESGGTATITVTLSNPSYLTTTLNAALSDALATITGAATCTGFPVDYTTTLTPAQVIFAPGVTTATITFDVCADAIDEANEDVLFTINGVPVTGAITVAGSDFTTVVTIVDDDAAPTVQIADVTASEATSPFAFQVTLIDPVSNAALAFTGNQVVLGYSITPGTATAGVDYTGTSGTLVIPAGTDLSVPIFINVPVINDALYEANETFTVTLTSAINATLTDDTPVNAADTVAIGTIVNDDTAPTVTITYLGPDSLGAPTLESDINGMIYTIDLSAAAGIPIEVGYYTGAVGDSATEGLDYGSIEDRIVIPAGAISYTVYIPVVDDALYEGGAGTTETATVRIYSTAASPFPITGSAVGLIEDDDTAPTLSINDVSVIETAGGINAVFVVTQSAFSDRPTNFNYALTDVSATGGPATALGVDYINTGGAGTIQPGYLTTTISISVENDAIYELTETYNVNLTLPGVGSNASGITDATGLGTIVNNTPQPTVDIIGTTLVEGAGGNVTITRNGLSQVPIVVNVATGDLTAIAPGDYVPSASTGVIPASLNATESIAYPVLTIEDTIDEPNEVFLVTLNSASNAVINVSPAIVVITDNDAAPTISIDDVTAVEGQLLTFTLTLSNPSASAVSVTYNLNDVNAVGNVDYVDATGTVTFAAGETIATLTVQSIQDLMFEPTETFTVDLTLPVNATILDAQGIGTITDNDAAPVVTSAADFNVNEGNGVSTTVTITVTLSNPSYETIQLNTGLAPLSPTLGGAATCTGFPIDVVFVPTPATLTFAPGATTATATIDICGDIIDEDNEVVQFNLTPAVGTIAATGNDFDTNVTIIDDDNAPLVVINDVTQVEETSPFVFTVTLLDPTTNVALAFTGRAVTIGYVIAEGTAIEPQDYVGLGGTIVIPANTALPSGITQISVPVIDDPFFEADETFTVTLTEVNNASLVDSFAPNFGDPIGLGTIVNTDVAPSVSVAYTGPVGGTPESDPTGLAYTITLNVAAGLPIEIGYNTGAVTDTAIAGLDYTDLADRVIFQPGTTSIIVYVPVINDALYEGPVNETVTMNIATTPNTPVGVTTGAPAVGSILDDDAIPSLVINDVQIIEGDAGSINAILTVTQSAFSGLPTSFVVNTADVSATAGADYTAIVAGAGTIPAGYLTTTISVPVLGDTIYEGPETFNVVLSAPVNATLADATGVVTIIDNDPLPRITITASPSPVLESGGNQTVVYTITLSNLSAFPVSFNWTTADGTASSTHDYSTASGLSTIPANTISVAGITVNVFDDLLFDLPSENYLLNLTNIVGADVPNSETSESVSITDNEAAPFLNFVTGTVVSATEGSNLVFTARLSTDAAGTIPTAVGTDIQFVMNSSDGVTLPVARLSQPDYKDADGTIYTFIGNGAVSSLPVIIESIDDLLPENTENVTAALSLPTGSLISLGSSNVREGQILDTPDAQPTVSIQDATVTEGATLDFVVSLSFVSGQDITVTVALADVTATTVADYTVPGVLTVTIPAGSGSAMFSVPTVQDVIYEVDETLTATLSAPVNASLLDAVATGTIINDDVPPTITINSVSVIEGNAGFTNAVLTVTLSQPAGVPVSVGYATSDGTATLADSDYVQVADQTLTIPVGSTTGTITTQIVGDLNLEADETYNVVLSVPENGTLGVPSVGVVTILNDDVQPTVTIAGPAVGTNEGTTDDTYRTFTFTLSAESNLPVLVNYTTVDGTITDFQALAADNDYAAQTATLTFAPGEVVKTIQVRVYADNKYENNEDYSVQITGALNATLGATLQAADTIVNDDQVPTVRLMADLSVIEDVTPVYVTATLSNPSGFPTILDLIFTDGPTVAPLLFAANNPADYLPVANTLTFPAGVTQIAVTNNGLSSAAIVSGTPAAVTIVNDLIDEYDERFTVAITGPNLASGPVGPGADLDAVITIIDNDRTPKLLVSDISVAEAAGVGTVTFSLVNPDTNLPVAIGRDVVVKFSLADGTAVVTNDYLNEVDIANPALLNQTCTTAALCTAIITGNGVATSTTIAITIVDDAVYENPDQYFFVNVEDATNVDTLTSDQQGIVTILDNDVAPTLSIAPAVSVNEGNSGVTPMVFNITLSAAAEAEISFLFNTRDGDISNALNPVAMVNDDDYVEIQPMIVTIPPLAVSTTVTVQVLGDTTYELNEYLTAQISGPVNAILGNANGIGQIVNDDARPVINLIDSTVFEGDTGTSSIVFDVVLETIAGVDVTFTVNTADGTATLADVIDGVPSPDYVAATAAGPFTIARGEQSTQITLQVRGDTKFEADEIFNVTITPDANATAGDVAAQGTIINDDDAPVIAINDVTVVETNAGTVNVSFTLTLSNAAQFAYPIPYKTFDGLTPPAATVADFDYNAQNSTYTLPQDITSATFTVVGLVNGDTKFELNDQFTFELLDVFGTGQPTFSKNVSVVTITNDDTAPVVTVNSALVVSTPEGNGPTFNKLVFTAVLSNATYQTLVVPFDTSDGTATVVDLDYDQIIDGGITFVENALTKTFSVNVIGDNKYELNETMNVTLDATGTGTAGTYTVGAPSTHFGTITNDDAAPTVTLPNLTGTEGTPMNITAVLSNPSYEAITVTLNTATGGANPATAVADYAPATAVTLTFPASSGLVNNVVSSAHNAAPVADGLYELPEHFLGTITAGTGTVTAVQATNSTFTIISNDPMPTLEITDLVSVNEGDTGTTAFVFTVTQSALSGEDTTFKITTIDGTAKSSAADYTAINGVTYIIPEGSVTLILTVSVNGDVKIEEGPLLQADPAIYTGYENFFVQISNVVNATLATDGKGEGRIINDDFAIPIIPPLSQFSFENGLGSWKKYTSTKTNRKDKIACNQAAGAVDGVCFFSFKGEPNEDSRLTVDIPVSQLPVGITLDDALRISMYYRSGTAQARIAIKLRVTFMDATPAIYFGAVGSGPTGGFGPEHWKELTANSLSNHDKSDPDLEGLPSVSIRNIRILIRHETNSGKLHIDDIRLDLLPSEALPRGAGSIDSFGVTTREGATLGLPAAPDGFRDGN